jgi:hypothetical protein
VKIEIVEFYPGMTDKSKLILKGSLHVYLIHLHLDIRGIQVSKEKHRWHFRWPQRWAVEDGKKVFYPVVSFTDPAANKMVLAEINRLGKDYIIKNFKELI